MSIFNYKRRPTLTVDIGGIPLGSRHPIRIQSMTSTSTMDTEGSIGQIKSIAQAGASYVRLTAQGVREAENIGAMRRRLTDEGLHIPLVADIHFNPKAAMAAAAVTDKVRINPGNFVDPGRTFRKIAYTDEEYAAELKRIGEKLVPLLDLCRANGTALRIGVNHGSLSDRIMSRYGDTPAGMVESAMEFLRVCVAHDFMQVAISIKASNTTVMVETVRRLVKAMNDENMHFPLHLGVTEAGDGEDGRIKSAVGIGTLLAEGIGDTIRVSLSEDPACEVPVAQTLLDHITKRDSATTIDETAIDGYDFMAPERMPSRQVGTIGGDAVTAVVADSDLCGADFVATADMLTAPSGNLKYEAIDAADPVSHHADRLKASPDTVVVLHSRHINAPGQLQAARHALVKAGVYNPVIMKLEYPDSDAGDVAIKSAADFGSLLLNGHRDGIWLKAPNIDQSRIGAIAFGILQAARCRITRTEFISCPGCGRTMFDLQATVKAVKEATSHLTGLKIGIMGCIVNGPGEMADADYGYVGAAAGRISLYKGKQCVEKNIPAEQAIQRLTELIKSSGDWKDR